MQGLLSSDIPMQVAYHIIKYSITTQVGYLSRVTAPSLCFNALKMFDIAVCDFIIQKFDLPKFLLSTYNISIDTINSLPSSYRLPSNSLHLPLSHESTKIHIKQLIHLRDSILLQIHLPIHLSGLGITETSVHCSSSYFSSYVNSLKTIQDSMPNIYQGSRESGPTEELFNIRNILVNNKHIISNKLIGENNTTWGAFNRMIENMKNSKSNLGKL